MFELKEQIQKNRYRILNKVVKNGVVTSYDAFDNESQSNVSISELQNFVIKSGDDANNEFNKFGQLLVSLNHKFIINVVDYFSLNGKNFLVSESIKGNSLEQILEKYKSPLPFNILKEWSDQLLSALNFLHQQFPPIIYANLNPANIYLASDGTTKIALAQIGEVIDAISYNQNQEIISLYLPYLSFEQIWKTLDSISRRVISDSFDEKFVKDLDLPSNQCSDLFSFGSIFYHLATGTPPIDSLTRIFELNEGKPDPLQPIRELNSKIEPEYSELFMRILEFKRENRTESVSFLQQQIKMATLKIQNRFEQDKIEKIDSNSVNKALNQTDSVLTQLSNPQAEELIEQVPVYSEVEQHNLESELIQAVAETDTSTVAEVKKVENKFVAEDKNENVSYEIEPIEAFEEPQLVNVVADEFSRATIIPEASVQDVLPDNQFETKLEEPVLQADSFDNESIFEQSESKKEIIKDNDNFQESFLNYDDDELVFAPDEPKNNPIKKLAMAAGALILLGGIGFGVWSFTDIPKSTPENQVVEKNTSNSDSPAPIENPTSIPAQTTVENSPTADIQPLANSSEIKVEINDSKENLPNEKIKPNETLTPKPKIAQVTQTPNKQKVQPAKNELPKKETPKKTVTLDDLLNES